MKRWLVGLLVVVLAGVLLVVVINGNRDPVAKLIENVRNAGPQEYVRTISVCFYQPETRPPCVSGQHVP